MEAASSLLLPSSSLSLRPKSTTRALSGACSVYLLSEWMPSSSFWKSPRHNLSIKAPGSQLVYLRKFFCEAVSDIAPSAPTNYGISQATESSPGDVEEFHNDFGVGGDDMLGSVVGQKMDRVSDKLIEVFMVDKPTTTDWRRLLAFSKQWNEIRPHFYSRCLSRADAESDPDFKQKLYRLLRKLKEVDDDMKRHNELLIVIRQTPSDINAVVAKCRKDFTVEFFEHLHILAESYYEDPEEQEGLVNLRLECLAAVQAFDNASQTIEALDAAELKFQDILNSPTLGAACNKIDTLAEKKQLDSALMLLLTKAWSTAKESTMMKDEVKDVLYHLYVTAAGNLQRLMPKEIRILKYLLTIQDSKQQLSSLEDAFTPGNEIEGKDVDCLYTTPDKLYTWIRTVLDAYHFSREGSLIREAKDLMNPKMIQKLEQLKVLVEKNFM